MPQDTPRSGQAAAEGVSNLATAVASKHANQEAKATIRADASASAEGHKRQVEGEREHAMPAVRRMVAPPPKFNGTLKAATANSPGPETQTISDQEAEGQRALPFPIVQFRCAALASRAGHSIMCAVRMPRMQSAWSSSSKQHTFCVSQHDVAEPRRFQQRRQQREMRFPLSATVPSLKLRLR